MKQTDHLSATLQRIVHFDFSKAEGTGQANAALLKEHLRRSILWGEAADCPWKWMFGDYAECIDPSVRAPDEAVEQVKRHITVEGYQGPVQMTCVNALHWAVLKDAMNLEAAYGLPDLYEPLLVLYGRGGYFLTRHGFIEIGGFSLLIGAREKYRDIKPLLSLDKVTLDVIDKGEQMT